MMPTLCDGDYVLVWRRRGQGFRPGDVVCVRRGDEPRLVKRLGASVDGGFRLAGDGLASQPSVDLGIVRPGQIEGRAIVRVSGSAISLIRAR